MLVGASALAFAAGWRVDEWRHGAAEVKTITRTITVLQKQAQTSVAVATKVQAGQDRVRYVAQTITKEIHDAVPPDADPALGFGFVRMWDAASLGVPPGPAPAGQPDDADSGLKASDALANATDNFTTANVCLIQLQGWQEWARKVGLVGGQGS